MRRRSGYPWAVAAALSLAAPAAQAAQSTYTWVPSPATKGLVSTCSSGGYILGTLCFDYGDRFACGITSGIAQGVETEAGFSPSVDAGPIGLGFEFSMTVEQQQAWGPLDSGPCELCQPQVCYLDATLRLWDCGGIGGNWTEQEFQAGTSRFGEQRCEPDTSCPCCTDGGKGADEGADGGVDVLDDEGVGGETPDEGVDAIEDIAPFSKSAARIELAQWPDYEPVTSDELAGLADLDPTVKCELWSSVVALASDVESSVDHVKLVDLAGDEHEVDLDADPLSCAGEEVEG